MRAISLQKTVLYNQKEANDHSFSYKVCSTISILYLF